MRILTQYEFRKLFTIEERVAITSAATSDPTVNTILGDLASTNDINMDDPGVLNSLGYLVSIGIITSNRMNEILITPIPSTPPQFEVVIKPFSPITVENISGAIEMNGKWIVRAEIIDGEQNVVHPIIMEFLTTPLEGDISSRINEEILKIQGGI